jgi:hypothetical protein
VNCSVCGAENSAGARFCKHCGISVSVAIEVELNSATISCPGCGKPNNPGAKFCTSCSSSLADHTPPSPLSMVEQAVECPQCDVRNKVGAAFCVACGYELTKGGANAIVESATVPMPIEQKVTTSPQLSSSSKLTAPEITEKNEHIKMWNMGNDEDSLTNFRSGGVNSKQLLWMLIAIAIGAAAAVGYVYVSRKANTPITIPSQVTAPPLAPTQNPVIAAHHKPSNTQPMPPQPVPPIDTATPSVSSPASAATSETKTAELKSTTAKPGRAKTERAAAQPVAREKHSATLSLSKSALPNKSDAQSVSASPKSQSEVSVANTGRSTYQRDLDDCRKMGLLERGICTERAKWKFCNVTGVWDDSKPGCEVN